MLRKSDKRKAIRKLLFDFLKLYGCCINFMQVEEQINSSKMQEAGVSRGEGSPAYTEEDPSIPKCQEVNLTSTEHG